MDINEIKKIVEADGGKFIFVEDGKPTMVVCSFEDYKNKLFKEMKGGPFDTAQGGRPASPRQNGSTPRELKEDELKIEDLPL